MCLVGFVQCLVKLIALSNLEHLIAVLISEASRIAYDKLPDWGYWSAGG